MAEIIGFSAGLFCAIAFIPQLVRIFKLKSSVEISFLFSICFLIGVVTWFVYGIIINSLSVIVWNIIMTILASLVLFMKVKYGRTSKRKKL